MMESGAEAHPRRMAEVGGAATTKTHRAWPSAMRWAHCAKKAKPLDPLNTAGLSMISPNGYEPFPDHDSHA